MLLRVWGLGFRVSSPLEIMRTARTHRGFARVSEDLGVTWRLLLGSGDLVGKVRGTSIGAARNEIMSRLPNVYP